MTRELLRLADWLHEEKVSQVAMESTRVYWKSVYNLLEDQGMMLLVVNASTSRRCRAERPMSRTPSGSPTCSATACCGLASSRIGASGSYSSWFATGAA